MHFVEKGVRPSWRAQRNDSEMRRKLQAVMENLNAKEAEGAALTRYNFIEMLVRVAIFIHARAEIDPQGEEGSVPNYVASSSIIYQVTI